jgi:hypothetical protein
LFLFLNQLSSTRNMADRFALIARKNEIRRQLEQATRQLEREWVQASPPNTRRVRQLENQIEQLMAAEYNLRLSIDRNGA